MDQAMSIEWLRDFCLSLPYTTEQLQWEDALVFNVGGKMYAVAMLEPGEHWLSLKCGKTEFGELVELPGIVPAPYLARAHWIAFQSENAVSQTELQLLLTRAYSMVLSKLPKKTQTVLASRKPRRKLRRDRKTAARRRRTKKC